MGPQHRGKAVGAQASVDFLMSYGIALIVIAIAIAAIYQISFSHPTLSSYTCTAVPGFSCDTYALNTTGALAVTLSQATGGPIVINGVACASQSNSIGNGPAYGNIFVTTTVAYYPTVNGITTSPTNGISLSSDAGTLLSPNCYASSTPASGAIGTAFTGYLWLNYTIPGYGSTIQQVASLSLVYTKFAV